MKTAMTTLRQAAQQALDALAGYRREMNLIRGESYMHGQPCDAEIALRAALEQAEKAETERDALRAELREATEATDDPAVNNLRTLPDSIRMLRAQRDELLEALAAAEREACAQLCEEWDSDSADPRDIAAAIRARGEKE